jgi:uncharacterized protein YlxP (DUF503 family)
VKVALLRATFVLHGCRSLKEKRRCLNGLRDRFGKSTGIAVCESGHQDDLQRAEWTFVGAASSAKVIEQTFSQIEQHLTANVDAELVDLEKEWLR